MNSDSIFIILIFSLVFVLIVLIVKTVFNTYSNVKRDNLSYIKLNHQIHAEEIKNRVSLSNILLLDQYNEALITRLFIIIKDILFVQKLIFRKHDK